jgi:NAD(P)-dependent dehydrogenase (short-subunit alcohol dehydrogenase family)
MPAGCTTRPARPAWSVSRARWRLALAPHRIRVNAIAPGLTDTAQPRYGNTEEQLAVRAREIPLGRMAQPEEIARVAVFLATSDACWITGELIHVNGGFYMA